MWTLAPRGTVLTESNPIRRVVLFVLVVLVSQPVRCGRPSTDLRVAVVDNDEELYSAMADTSVGLIELAGNITMDLQRWSVSIEIERPLSIRPKKGERIRWEVPFTYYSAVICRSVRCVLRIQGPLTMVHNVSSLAGNESMAFTPLFLLYPVTSQGQVTLSSYTVLLNRPTSLFLPHSRHYMENSEWWTKTMSVTCVAPSRLHIQEWVVSAAQWAKIWYRDPQYKVPPSAGCFQMEKLTIELDPGVDVGTLQPDVYCSLLEKRRAKRMAEQKTADEGQWWRLVLVLVLVLVGSGIAVLICCCFAHSCCRRRPQVLETYVHADAASISLPDVPDQFKVVKPVVLTHIPYKTVYYQAQHSYSKSAGGPRCGSGPHGAQCPRSRDQSNCVPGRAMESHSLARAGSGGELSTESTGAVNNRPALDEDVASTSLVSSSTSSWRSPLRYPVRSPPGVTADLVVSMEDRYSSCSMFTAMDADTYAADLQHRGSRQDGDQDASTTGRDVLGTSHGPIIDGPCSLSGRMRNSGSRCPYSIHSSTRLHWGGVLEGTADRSGAQGLGSWSSWSCSFRGSHPLLALKLPSSMTQRRLLDAVQNNPFGCEVVRYLGAGGSGAVYLAVWQDTLVALKVMLHRVEPSGVGKARALAEAMLGSRVRQPNVVATLNYAVVDPEEVFSLYSVGSKDELLAEGVMTETYILMEYCDKGTLRSLIGSAGWSPCGADYPLALHLLMGVARAMQYLHAHQVVHGDLKASNVLLNSCPTAPGGLEVKVGDFGIARILQEVDCSHTTVSRPVGTLTHMAPEMLQGKALSKAADIYAFGILLYEVMAGKPPFTGYGYATVIFTVTQCDLRDVLRFPPGCDVAVVHLAHRCWSKAPRDRPTIEEVQQCLIDLLALCGSSSSCSSDGVDDRPVEDKKV